MTSSIFYSVILPVVIQNKADHGPVVGHFSFLSIIVEKTKELIVDCGKNPVFIGPLVQASGQRNKTCLGVCKVAGTTASRSFEVIRVNTYMNISCCSSPATYMWRLRCRTNRLKNSFFPAATGFRNNSVRALVSRANVLVCCVCLFIYICCSLLLAAKLIALRVL